MKTNAERFGLLLKKLNLSDKKISKADKDALIEMYDPAFGLLHSVLADLLPYMELSEIDDTVADILSKAIKSNINRSIAFRPSLN